MSVGMQRPAQNGVPAMAPGMHGYPPAGSPARSSGAMQGYSPSGSSPSSPSAALRMQACHDADMFLFVNPSSGGNKGKDFMEVPQPFETTLDDGRQVRLHIYSLPDKPSSAEGFAKLKGIADKTGRPIRMIVGGGDGTVMWADSAATEAGIDTSRQVVFGIIPLGTGNDFSRIAGWGGKNPKRILLYDCQKLHLMVKMWCKAETRPHDVWLVEAEVDDAEGRILKVSKEKTEVDLKDNAKGFSLPMINYFSVGQESKVGIEFDKRRTKSQSCNLVMYACSGIMTECDCMSQQKIADIVSSLHAGEDASAPAIFEYIDTEDEEDSEEAGKLVGNPESIMFLNVNSYAGGAAHFWQNESELGVEPDLNPKDVTSDADPGDGKIEVVTLPNIVNIALDRLHGDARRVHSGGPYYMEFFQPQDGVDALHAYCEVDGEFYHLINPLCVSVLYKKKLMVLQCNDPDARNILKKMADSGKEIAGQTMQNVGGVAKGAVAAAGNAAAGAAGTVTNAAGAVAEGVNGARVMAVSTLTSKKKKDRSKSPKKEKK